MRSTVQPPRCRKQHRDDQNDQQHDRQESKSKHARENEKGGQRDERADHEDVAMGEVDHPDDPVDHRVTDRDQPIDGA
jgi:hypothetical protein